jgi:hypothetical protein
MAGFGSPWLVVFLLTAGLVLGAMVALALARLLGEAWLEPLRPPLSAMARAAPVLVLLALPLVVVVPLAHGWHGAGFALAPLVVWAVLGRLLSRDRVDGWTAGVSLMVLVLTGAFAMEAWALSGGDAAAGSLRGVSLVVEPTGAALALAALVALRQAVAQEEARRGLERALLTLAMAALWLGFVQFIVAYAADLPTEVAWYLERSAGVWGWVQAGIALPALLLAIALALVPQWAVWRMVAVCLLMLVHHVAQTLWVLRPDGAMAVLVAAAALPVLGLLAVGWRAARPFRLRPPDNHRKDTPRWAG